MDWLQFISSLISSLTTMVGSLAWPAVVAFLIYQLRAQLASLARRISEFSFPGGGKAVFSAEVNDAVSTAENVANAVSTTPPLGSAEHLELITEKPEIPTKPLAESPKDIIEHEYLSIDDYIKNKIAIVPLERRKNPSDFIYYELMKIDHEEVYRLYRKIGDLYIIARNSNSGDITQYDADQYKYLCGIFRNIFETEFSRWLEQDFAGKTHVERQR
ncbi:hypothetical protein FPV16_14860 [Methylobacterium sp. W2]|uniref:hypothetical protein n=1 Tax=Methylobacterium sp. W2 TaxID=2598107 RepID=UPI001D0C6B79|nr:hypothetical protein [Methylobacterium sp. W2]MCC0807494.1 hypothetical protein [Methylobacterium sp. W2]